MTSMIERIAKRIYEKRNGPGCRAWAHIGKPHQQPYLIDASAAIEAMKGPGPDVLRAAFGGDDMGGLPLSNKQVTELFTSDWDAAMDVALGKETP